MSGAMGESTPRLPLPTVRLAFCDVASGGLGWVLVKLEVSIQVLQSANCYTILFSHQASRLFNDPVRRIGYEASY